MPKIRTPTELGASIRDRRRGLGLGQLELAKRVGVSRQWIVEVEKGKARAEIGLILRTLDVLGIPLTVARPNTTGDSTTPSADIDQIVSAARRGGRS